MAQHLQSRHYALLNKDSGLYLAHPSHHKYLVLKDPDFSRRKDEVFQVDIMRTYGNGNYDLTVNTDNNNLVASSIHNIMVEIVNNAALVSSPPEGIWIMHQHKDGPYKGFCRLEDKYSGKYMDISKHEDQDDNYYAHLNAQHTRDSQFWRFVPIHLDWDPVKTHSALLSAQNEFRITFRDQSASPARSASGFEKYSASSVVSGGPYSGPNICRNPTCGIDHICTEDYYRRLPAKLAGYDPEDPAT